MLGRPPVVASPCGWAARSNWDHVAPAPTRAIRGIDLDRGHAADVDDEPVVDEREPGHRVAAGADGEREAVAAGEGDRLADLSRRAAARDVRRAPFDRFQILYAG